MSGRKPGCNNDTRVTAICGDQKLFRSSKNCETVVTGDINGLVMMNTKHVVAANRFPDSISSNMKVAKNGGLTLIELLIAITVMGILMTIAIPRYQNLMERNRLSGAARQVASDLVAARMEAVNMNRRVQVFFTGGTTYQICDDENRDGTVTLGEGRNIARNIQDTYFDVTIAAGANPIFRPNGTTTNVTITLSNGSGSVAVTISRAGRVLIN